MIPADDVRDRLRLLAEATPRGASSKVEERLRAEFRRRHRASRVRLYAAGLLAASLLLMAGVYRVRGHAQRPAVEIHGAHGVELPGFIPLPYAESGVPLEEPVIVRTTISASELNGIGLRSGSREAPARVAADVLIGQDGVPRAVRFVQ